jgi:hyaluronoglucosaminidase
MRRAMRRAGVALVVAAAVPLLAACAKTPAGSTTTRSVAWVTTSASVTLPGKGITPVDLPKGRAGQQVVLGSLPSALAYTAGDTGLLVVTQGDDTLHEVDPATHAVVHIAGVGVEPDAVAVAPGGTGGQGMALVANLGSNTVTPVDLGTWHPGPPIAVGSQPVAIAVETPAPGTPGSPTAFVADFGSDQVTPIDLATMQAGPPIAVGPGPQTLAVVAGDVLVGNFSNSTLTPIDIATLRPGAAVPLPLNPTAMAVASAGSTAYVCGGAGVVPVTVTIGQVALGTVITLPGVAQGIALDETGTTAWVTQRAGSMVPVTLSTGAVGRPVHLGGHPSAIVIGAG